MAGCRVYSKNGCWTNCRYKTGVWWTEQVSEFLANDNVCAFEQKLSFYKTYRHTSMTASHYLNCFDEVSGSITVSFWYYVMKCVNIRKISVSCCKFVRRWQDLSKYRPPGCDPTGRQFTGTVLGSALLPACEKAPLALLGRRGAEGGRPNTPPSSSGWTAGFAPSARD